MSKNHLRRPQAVCLAFLGLLAVGTSAWGLEARFAEEGADQSRYVQGSLVHHVTGNADGSKKIVMIPGMNLSSSIFLSTPDGREGWAQVFAEAGYDVWIVNDPDLDFSRGFDVEGFDIVPTEGRPPADQNAVRAWGQDVWRRWGFGEREGAPYDNTRFPTAEYEHFEAAYPYVTRSRRSHSAAVVTLLEEIGSAVVLAHSAGARIAVDVATGHPDLVRELVLIEPAGPPAADDFPALAGKSMLGVYGDFIDSRRQGGRMQATLAAAALFEANGGRGDVVSLPEGYQVFGNTHLMMQDNNHEQIADLILHWLDGGGVQSMDSSAGDAEDGVRRGGRGGAGGAEGGGRRRGGAGGDDAGGGRRRGGASG